MVANFWDRVDQSGGPESCWLWTGPVNPGGYGVASRNGGRSEKAHRQAFCLANGWMPRGNRRGDLVVRHTCDAPRCCNPAHLIVGTHKQNTQDAASRKRLIVPTTLPGCDHARAKFSESEVAAIRAASASGESAVSIARKMNAGASTIRRIVRGESYQGWGIEKAGAWLMAKAVERLHRKAMERV